jgi:hypothetical protein
MLERISRLTLILLAVGAAIFPTLFPHELENHRWPFVAVSAGLAIAAIWWQREYDSREARKAGRLSHKLELQESRSATLAWMIKILVDAILIIELEHNWTAEEKQKAVDKLNAAMTQILRALSKDISVYVDEKPDVSVNTNLMVAHRIDGSSPSLLDDLGRSTLFLGYQRRLSGYTWALQLILWGREEADIPPLVLPVEDPRNDAGKRRLLPGGPAALALGKDRLVPDTHKIREYVHSDPDGVGSALDPDVLIRVDEYFRSKQFRSFASLVLRDPAAEKPIGVLNIQSDEPERFRPGVEMETLIKSLEHYRFSLQYLLNGQRKLLGIVS